MGLVREEALRAEFANRLGVLVRGRRMSGAVLVLAMTCKEALWRAASHWCMRGAGGDVVGVK